MIKCQCDIEEFGARHIARRPSCEDQAMRDRAIWAQIDSAPALSAVAAEVKRELLRGDFARFEDWACRHLGLGLARAAGLMNHQPRLVVSA